MPKIKTKYLSHTYHHVYIFCIGHCPCFIFVTETCVYLVGQFCVYSVYIHSNWCHAAVTMFECYRHYPVYPLREETTKGRRRDRDRQKDEATVRKMNAQTYI